PRARERLGEEDRLRVGGPDILDEPLPEGHRLRMRVVDAVDAHAALAPAHDDGAEGLPETLPVLRVPVEVVDVLILLGRVLGVLERAVRAVLAPLRVLGPPRAVGGGLARAA